VEEIAGAGGDLLGIQLGATGSTVTAKNIAGVFAVRGAICS
jgi:hypothetical protein